MPSFSSRNFDDAGTISIGSACPFTRRSGGEYSVEEHQFTATLYYRNPVWEISDLGKIVNIGAGLRLADKTIWSSVEKYKFAENLAKSTQGIIYSSATLLGMSICMWECSKMLFWGPG